MISRTGGTDNPERRYYACETFRRYGRAHSDCALLKKEALEAFVLDILKDKVFTRQRIAEAIRYLVSNSREDDKAARREQAKMKSRITKLQL